MSNVDKQITEVNSEQKCYLTIYFSQPTNKIIGLLTFDDLIFRLGIPCDQTSFPNKCQPYLFIFNKFLDWYLICS